MIKLIAIYFLGLEIAQLLTVFFICICFIVCKYIFHMSEITWKYILQEMNYKRIVLGLSICQIVSLLVVIPFSFWWFSLWDISYQKQLSISIPVLSFLMFLGQILAIKKYLSSRNVEIEKKNNHIYR